MGYSTRIKNLACRIILGRHFVARGPGDREAIAITFDDGPHPQFTPMLLDLLESHGARGTFFLIGEFAQARPDIVRRMVAAGHEIGNHSMRHQAFALMATERQIAEIAEAERVLAGFDGRDSHWFRPPQGRVTPRMLLELGRRRHSVAMWSLDSFDYRGHGVETILRRFESRRVAPGEVVLFHDDNACTVEALAKLLPAWRERGFAFPTLSELVSGDGPLGEKT